MSDSVLEFYDGLAENYHLIGTDWPGITKHQGQVLSSIIRRRSSGDNNNVRVLDCTCGVGTQAIGLALAGYSVRGTDLSPKAIEKARENAKELGARLTFGVADVKDLSQDSAERYDVVVSCDNSLPHLLEPKDLDAAAQSILRALKPGGIFIGSIRDYDEIKKQKPSGMLPRKFSDSHGARVYFQTWNWESEDIYELELFILQNKGSGWLAPSSYKTRYRAIQRVDIDVTFIRAGFASSKWLLGEENPYYQPIVICTAK